MMAMEIVINIEGSQFKTKLQGLGFVVAYHILTESVLCCMLVLVLKECHFYKGDMVSYGMKSAALYYEIVP